MKKIFLFIILALYGYSGMGYTIHNRTSSIVIAKILRKDGDSWTARVIAIKGGSQMSFHFNNLNHVDINISGKTVAQPDKNFFDKSDSRTILVYKVGGAYKVVPYHSYIIKNRTGIDVKANIWEKIGDHWNFHKIKIKGNSLRDFKYMNFNHVDINIAGKTVAQPDRKFFEKSDSKTISVSKDSKGGYKVQPE